MEKVRKNNIITTISIYSSRVSSCIAILDEDISLNIAGLGKSDGKLLGRKGVLNIDALSRAIRDSLKAAQEEANVKSAKTFVGISGGSISGEKSRGIIRLSPKGKEISDRELRDVLKIADTIPIGMEREIIHSIPQDFIVDGQNDIKDPVGLHGVKLEAETLLITAHLPFLQNVAKSLNLAGIELEDVVFSGMAASKCLLSQDTVGKGVILIEIDNNFIALSVFYDNILIGVYILEKSIITDGALEILKGELDNIRQDKTISKIILAGGGYIHEDFIERVNKIFGIPSQMAYARNIKGTARDMNNPCHISSMGLAIFGFEKQRNNLIRKNKATGILRRATRRMGEFLEEYF